MAKPIPVLPDVPSMMVPPGLSNPAASASSIIFTAIRSFIELPGLVVSILANIVPFKPLTMRLSFTMGVLPIVSRMLSCHITLMFRWLEFQVLHGQPVVDELAERFDTDGQVSSHEFSRYAGVAFHRLYPFGYHRLVRNQKKCSGWDFIGEAYRKDGGRFHVDQHGADTFEVFLEILVVFPYPSVGGIHGTRPIIERVVAYGRRNGLLQRKSR